MRDQLEPTRKRDNATRLRSARGAAKIRSRDLGSGVSDTTWKIAEFGAGIG
ncbi:hypothetical protein Bra1253DRAFT_00075 [Bradyrhizobium sp. WSM1253]|nr:hypothetical protein Bra1253DRAFT_00075 [Bradyrhizobium sp. WSM1253]